MGLNRLVLQPSNTVFVNDGHSPFRYLKTVCIKSVKTFAVGYLGAWSRDQIDAIIHE